VAALLLLLQMQTNACIRLARRNFLRSRFSDLFLALSLHAFVCGTFRNQCARSLNLIRICENQGVGYSKCPYELNFMRENYSNC